MNEWNDLGKKNQTKWNFKFWTILLRVFNAEINGKEVQCTTYFMKNIEDKVTTVNPFSCGRTRIKGICNL